MPRYLADTSAWNRARHVLERWSDLLLGGDIVTCSPVRLELLYAATSKRNYGDLARELMYLRDLPVDARTTRLAEATQAALAERSQHRGPTAADLLIAATAQRWGATLLHYDRHFDAIARGTGQPAEWVAPRGSLD